MNSLVANIKGFIKSRHNGRMLVFSVGDEKRKRRLKLLIALLQ